VSKKKAAKKSTKKKQKHLKGMEPKRIKSIDGASEAYRALRDQRMKLLSKEVDAQRKLLELMKKHKLKTYSYDGYNVEIDEGKEKVKVKAKKEEKD